MESDEVSVFKARHIKVFIEKEFKVKYATSSIFSLLRRLKFSRIKGRPQHEKNDEKLIKQWREVTLPNTYAGLKEKYCDKKIDVWFQDEMRFGTKTRTACQWRLTGTSYRQIKQIGFRNSYIYGAVNPLSGEHVGLVFSECSTDVMNIHLNLISQAVQTGHHALLILDCAGWHSSAKDLKIPENISLLDLPPYSPELNPVERLWLWLKDEHLSNYVFKKDESLLDFGAKMWKSLSAERVKSICHEKYLAFTNFS